MKNFINNWYERARKSLEWGLRVKLVSKKKKETKRQKAS